MRASGIDDKDIIYLDLDKRGNRGIKTPDALEAAIAKATVGEGTKTAAAGHCAVTAQSLRSDCAIGAHISQYV